MGKVKTYYREPYNFIGLGAGVQSTVMTLMADRGILQPMPLAAIFADTQWEPFEVYDNLDWLSQEVKNFPIVKVTAGNLRLNMIKGKSASGHKSKKHTGYSSMPLYLAEKGKKKGVARRTCTNEYKIRPMERYMREYCGVKPKQVFPDDKIIIKWMGISIDELTRMRNSRHKWEHISYPLINIGFTREDCLNWFNKYYPERANKLHRSACLGCPYHSKEEWLEIKDNPEYWEDVVAFDKLVRRISNYKSYLHNRRVPIDQIDFEGEQTKVYSTWEQECEGMCGI